MTEIGLDAVPPASEANINRFSFNHTIARRLPFRTVPIRLDRPILSISFDDFPVSAHELGATLLEERGVRGTYYACTGQLGSTTDLWTVVPPDAVVDLHQRGHEIGLHSHGHAKVHDLSPAAFRADLAANRAALRRLLPGTSHETFAYPMAIPASDRSFCSASSRGQVGPSSLASTRESSTSTSSRPPN